MENVHSLREIVNHLLRLNVVISVAFWLQRADTCAVLSPFVHPQGLIAIDTFPMPIHVFEQIEQSKIFKDISNVGIRGIAMMAGAP